MSDLERTMMRNFQRRQCQLVSCSTLVSARACRSLDDWNEDQAFPRSIFFFIFSLIFNDFSKVSSFTRVERQIYLFVPGPMSREPNFCVAWRSSAAACAITVRQSPGVCCRNNRMLGYQGVR